MTDISKSGTFTLGDRAVKRLGYGAMQLAGPGVFGPPKNRNGALAVLREALAAGIDHIDTSDFYGPHITNQLIREALHPYPDDLVLDGYLGERVRELGKRHWVGLEPLVKHEPAKCRYEPGQIFPVLKKANRRDAQRGAPDDSRDDPVEDRRIRDHPHRSDDCRGNGCDDVSDMAG